MTRPDSPLPTARVAALPLVAAPLVDEIEPFLALIGAYRSGRLPGGWTWRGELGGKEILAAVLGDGEDRSRRSLEVLLERHGLSRALMIGVAGGLSPDLRIGDLVRAEIVVREGGQWASESGGDGRVISSKRIVASRSEKAALWARKGEEMRCVVDLESAGFALLLEASGVNWAVCRAVSDTAEESLPAELVSASDDGGHVSRIALLRGLLARPRALSELISLRGRVEECAPLLAEAARIWVEEER